jgi:inorganic pyrophosphatase
MRALINPAGGNHQDRAPVSARSADGLVHVVVDTPRGSGNKYKYDEETGLFKLSRMLPDGLHFPCDFGSIPGTIAEDGDALDVIVLSNAAFFVGCLLSVKLIGIIKALQTEARHRVGNDRLVAVPVTPVNQPAFNEIAEVPRNRIVDIEQFFVAYNSAQGRAFRITGRQGAAGAERALRRATKAHDLKANTSRQ